MDEYNRSKGLDPKQISEDSRFLVIAFCLLKAGDIAVIFKWFKVAEKLVNYEDFEDAAAVSTLFSAFEIIIFEFSRELLQQGSISSVHKNLLQENVEVMADQTTPGGEVTPHAEAPQNDKTAQEMAPETPPSRVSNVSKKVDGKLETFDDKFKHLNDLLGEQQIFRMESVS